MTTQSSVVEADVRCPKCGRIGVISYPDCPTNRYPVPEGLRCPAPCGTEFEFTVAEHAVNGRTWSLTWL